MTYSEPLPDFYKEDIKRFWLNVAKDDPEKCWLWKLACGTGRNKGYGRFKVGGKTVAAHRVAYFLANGKEANPVTRHTCDNRPCCNPDHLIEGTVKDNVTDRYLRARDNHPVSGAHFNSKLSWEQVLQIRERRSNGEKLRALAEEYGVAQSTICVISRNKSRTYQEYVPVSQR